MTFHRESRLAGSAAMAMLKMACYRWIYPPGRGSDWLGGRSGAEQSVDSDGTVAGHAVIGDREAADFARPGQGMPARPPARVEEEILRRARLEQCGGRGPVGIVAELRWGG